MFKLKKKSGKTSPFIDFRRFVWYGFTFTGGAFNQGFYAVAQPNYLEGEKYVPNPHAIGLHSLWMGVVTGLVAMGVALVFSKLVHYHRMSKNGGSYIVTRSAFGRFAGYLVSMVTYIGMPFIITIQITYFMRGLFSVGYIGKAEPRLVAHWGSFTLMYLDLISIVIYLSVALIVFGGVQIFKKINTSISIFNNVFGGVLGMLTSLIIFVPYFQQSFAWWTATPDYTANGAPVDGGNVFHFSGIFFAFNNFLFSFAGFEVFSATGLNLRNPERELGSGLRLIMIFAILAGVVGSVLEFGAFYGNKGAQSETDGYGLLPHNMINKLARPILGGKGSGFYWFSIVLGIIIEILFICRMSSDNVFYGGTMLQPLAEEGYIPEKFKQIDAKDNFARAGSKLNMRVTVIVLSFWLVIPDLIIGGLATKGSEELGAKVGDVFNSGLFLNMSGMLTALVYAAIVASALKLSLDKKIVSTRTEYIKYVVLLITLIIPCFYFFFDQFVTMKKGGAEGDTIAVIGGALSIIYVVIAFSAFFLIYRFYYLPKYHKRLAKDPSIQKRLDAQFKTYDWWWLANKKITSQLQDYVVANKLLFAEENNKNLATAQEMLGTLEKAQEDAPYLVRK